MATISGRIVDQWNSAPLEGVAVTAESSASDTRTSTDADGRFAIDGLAPGQYEISAEKQGYEPAIYGPLALSEKLPFELSVALPQVRD